MTEEPLVFNEAGHKLIDMYSSIRDLVEKELMKFTYEELRMLKMLYGNELTYPLYADIIDTLEGATPLDRIH